jgi:hypothetical protein
MFTRGAKSFAVAMFAVGYATFQTPTTPEQKSSAGLPPAIEKGLRENGESYFPAGTFRAADGSPNDRSYDSVAWHLHGIEEPPLLDLANRSGGQAYRLIWLGFPAAKTIVLRLEIGPDGAAKLFVKQAPFGKATLVVDREESIPIAAANGFLECVKNADFWQMPTNVYPEPKVADGSYWYLEGAIKGKYHMVYRRVPELHPDRFTDIGRYLAKDLGGLEDSVISIPRSGRGD